MDASLLIESDGQLRQRYTREKLTFTFFVIMYTNLNLLYKPQGCSRRHFCITVNNGQVLPCTNEFPQWHDLVNFINLSHFSLAPASSRRFPLGLFQYRYQAHFFED